jgi:hypothetical protein
MDGMKKRFMLSPSAQVICLMDQDQPARQLIHDEKCIFAKRTARLCLSCPSVKIPQDVILSKP